VPELELLVSRQELMRLMTLSPMTQMSPGISVELLGHPRAPPALWTPQGPRRKHHLYYRNDAAL